MGKLTIIEFFLRGLPEAFLFIIAAYGFSKIQLNIRKFLVSSVIFGIIGGITRILPIHYGVHTILNIFAFIIIIHNINKIDLVKSIKVGVISIIIQSVCELFNIVIIQFVFKQDMNYILSNPTLKTLYGIPSILIFGIIVVSSYVIMVKRKNTRQVSNGEFM